VATVLLDDITVAAEANDMQVLKPSSETWTDPVEAPAEVWAVSVLGSMGREKVTLRVGPAIGVAPSWGEVVTTPGTGSPAQTPAVQVSSTVLGLPSSQVVPSASLDQSEVFLLGAHTWQELLGFTVPAATSEMRIKQSATQLPPLHTSPPPHDVPSSIGVCLQMPEPLQESTVQGLLSSGHGVPAAAFTTVQPPLPSQVELAWHTPGLQVWLAPPHVPFVHESFEVQGLPSSHAVPFARDACAHEPVTGLQAAEWHWSWGEQTTGLLPRQTPDWQVSVCVQALPSLHAVPSESIGREHTPVAGLQAPAAWH
jgi:hypothetical protein